MKREGLGLPCLLDVQYYMDAVKLNHFGCGTKSLLILTHTHLAHPPSPNIPRASSFACTDTKKHWNTQRRKRENGDSTFTGAFHSAFSMTLTLFWFHSTRHLWLKRVERSRGFIPLYHVLKTENHKFTTQIQSVIRLWNFKTCGEPRCWHRL